MNASDIVKAKQNKVLYNAYYKPTVYSSTVYSTLQVYSSIGSVIDNTDLSVSESYSSTINTVYKYVNNPTVLSYESLNQIKSGANACGATSDSHLQLDRIPSTMMYTYSTVYSTFTAQNLILPSSVMIMSTLIPLTPVPVVQPFIGYTQPPSHHYDNQSRNCQAPL